MTCWVLPMIIFLGGAPDASKGWSRLEIRLSGAVLAVVPADEDGDGRQDLVIAHGSSTGTRISVLRQGPSGFPAVPQETWTVPGGAFALLVEDLVEGGGAEVATLHRRGIILHEAKPRGEGRSFVLWRKVESFFQFAPEGRLARWDLAGDLDGDTLADLFVPSSDGYRIISGGPRGEAPGIPLQVPSWSEIDPFMPSSFRGRLFTAQASLPRLVKRDLDGDGRKDLAFLHGGALTGFLRGRDGSFPSRPDLKEELLPIQKLGAGAIGEISSQLADLTGDGTADLVVSRVTGEVGFFETLRAHIALFHGKGPGRFRDTPDQIILVKGVSIEPRLLDFDRDGDLDLFVSALRTDLLTNIKNIVIRWVTVTYQGYLNDGDGRYPTAPSLSWDVEIPVGSIEQGKTVPLAWFEGDFDGDGMGDVLSVGGPEETAAYRGIRAGDEVEFGTDPIFHIPGAASGRVEIRDLTGDGRSDVIMRFPRGPRQNAVVLILSPGRGGR